MQNTAYKQTRAYTTVHKKLMAAIAMLLIASILLATTTYAWYVLSTAPEVTGITTTVGSNGALEIALVSDVYTQGSDVPSSTGDSIATTGDATVSNITWGNLIDLSDEDYGFGEMTLNLAAYNANSSSLADLLSYPLYGADGRVSGTQSALTVASYDPDNVAFQIFSAQTDATASNPLPSYMGVRVLGVSSSTSASAQALSSQNSAISSAVKSASSTVKNAMSVDEILYFAYDYTSDSTELASATGTFGTNYLDTVDTIITAMETTNSKIEAAMKAAILAYVTTDETLYTKYYASLYAMDFDTMYTEAETAGVVPTSVSSVKTTYDSLVTATTSARTAYDAVEANADATLSDLKDALAGLMDMGSLSYVVNGESKTLTELQTLGLGLATSEIVITINDGGGALYDLATLIGNYTVSANSADATLTTAYDGDAALDALKTYVAGLSSYDADNASATNPVTDIYGYVMDFWFRTNAETGAYLQLQTDSALRVSNADDSVQGAGSYVQFANDVDDTLANAVKLLFVDSSGSVLATAGISSIDDDNKGWLALDGSYITELTQNTAQQISVVVYIDGEEVDNTMVSADSELSFTLNLQFSTDATLTPMTYSSGYASIADTIGD